MPSSIYLQIDQLGKDVKVVPVLDCPVCMLCRRFWILSAIQLVLGSDSFLRSVTSLLIDV